MAHILALITFLFTLAPLLEARPMGLTAEDLGNMAIKYAIRVWVDGGKTFLEDASDYSGVFGDIGQLAGYAVHRLLNGLRTSVIMPLLQSVGISGGGREEN